MICEKCKKENTAEASFCRYCGHWLKTPELNQNKTVLIDAFKKRLSGVIIVVLSVAVVYLGFKVSNNKAGDDTEILGLIIAENEEEAPAPIEEEEAPAPIEEEEAPAPPAANIVEDTPPLLPQIDSSTARIPITNAIYELFTNTYGFEGNSPKASLTHGAWLNLADKTADILFTVAPTADELAYFAERNVDIEFKVYGYDGLVFIGNASNPVSNLTSKQIRDIYSGNITDWSEVGGEAADILTYIRNPESGSQRLFESLVWDGYIMPDFSSGSFGEGDINPNVTQRTVTLYNYMADAAYDVTLNQYSIGYNISSYIDSEFKNSPLKLFSVNGYAPTTENFISGAYPYLTTSIVAIRADEPEGGPARELFDWVGSEESLQLIAQNSTLAVSVLDSLIVKAGESFPERKDNGGIEAMIARLDREHISREDLQIFTLDEIGYIRNGIYALSGKIFVNEKFKTYFESKGWYYGNEQDDNTVSGRFNNYQKENLKVVLAYEDEISG